MRAWLTDDEMRDVADHLAIALHRLMLAKNPIMEVSPGYFFPPPPEITESMSGITMVEEFLQIDHAKLVHNFDCLERAKALITSDQMNAAIHDLEGVTNHWQGSAADAFQDYVSHIRTFTTRYREDIGILQHRLVEIYQLALLARRNYHALAESTIVAANRYIAERAEHRSDVAIETLAGFATAAIAAAHGGPAAIALAMAAEVLESAIELSTDSMGGDDPDTIMTSYLTACGRLLDRLSQDMQSLAELNYAHRSALSNRTSRDVALLQPLPPSTNIHRVERGDYFEYIDFAPVGEYSDAPPPGKVDQTIVEQTGPPADSQFERILRALSGG